MPTYFDDQLIREIESRLDIVDIVAETVKLTRKGNRFWGLCPFHNEKTSSFSVSSERNMYYCFGCQSGGDLFSFVMKRDGLEFKEVLEMLASRAGVEMPDKPAQHGSDQRKRILQANRMAADFFQSALAGPGGQTARHYLENRDILPETIERFQLGWAPDSWNALSEFLLKRGFSQEELSKASLIKRSQEQERYFDQFRKRIIFPIQSYNGEVVGFGGRILDEGFPKYLNSAETDLFQKRRNLYGLFQARDKIRTLNEAIVVEGYMDCIRLHQSGVENVIATLGTSLTQEQAALLLRYAEKVLVLYDGDEAGQRQTLKAMEVLKAEGLKVDVLSLPDGNDPDEFLALHGKEEFLQYIQNNRISHIEYKILKQLQAAPMHDVEGKIRVIHCVREDIQGLDSELEKDYYLKILARKLAVEENIVARELQARPRNGKKEGVNRNKTQLLRDNIIYGNYSIEEKILATVLIDPQVHRRLRAAIPGRLFDQPEAQSLLEVYEELQEKDALTPANLRKRAEEMGMGAFLARMGILGDNPPPRREYEIEEYIFKMQNREREQRWHSLYEQLEEAKNRGDFSALLGFILKLDTFLH
ncbi:MAG TPA: DNA primase [Syntrophomonadaceae bacterium]|nr:DNA primase [Syntrophomonadaceae bacterium]